LFQFKPETAARFGLAQDEFVDERRSITRSTAAATAHLSDMFERYGSWDLALAGYQLGQEKMDAAIEKWREVQKPGKENAPVTLADLAERGLVPRTTTNFVSQVHAFGLVAANRGLLRLNDLDPAEPLELSEIAVPQGTRLKTIAAAAGISVATLRDYNPELLRDRIPPTGGDVLVNLPADRVERAVAAFPVYLAREAAEAEPAGGAEPASSAAAQAPSAKATSPAPPAGAATPTLERWILDDGVAVERVAAASEEVELVARVDILEPTRTGWRATGERFAADKVKTAPPGLDRGVAQAIERLNTLAAGGGGADLALRRRIAAARRPILEGVPYGSSWIALSEALFPQGHPHEGAMLAGLLQPAAEVLFSEHEPRRGARITLAVHGPAEREAIDKALARALGSFAFGAGAPYGPHPREERRTVAASVAYKRLLIGWIAPPRAGAGEAAVRLALAVLVHGKIGRVQRAIVLDRRLAARVRGVLELGRRGSVAAIEVVPAVPHDVAEVQAALDAVIEDLGRNGPTPEQLGAAKAVLRAGLDKERMLAASARALKELRVREVERTLAAIDGATADDVRNAAKDVLSREHRVIVVTQPRK
jgi:soluble lytic murein transglycosylase-like protein